MPIKRLEKARRSLPPDYQYPSGGGGEKSSQNAPESLFCGFWRGKGTPCGVCPQCVLSMEVRAAAAWLRMEFP